MLDFSASGAAETARMIRGAGGNAAAHTVDITNRAAVEAAVAEVEKGGPIGILVNNTRWDEARLFFDTDVALWKKVIAINLCGPFHMHHAVLPGMVRNGGGRVINISSDAGRVGSSGEAVYSACKGGIISFTNTMARELARKNLLLNVMAPGPTDTPLFAEIARGRSRAKIAEGLKHAIPSRRLAQPSDYPGIVRFLASDDGGYIIGQVIPVSGGMSMY